jgi:hypothetical protein
MLAVNDQAINQHVGWSSKGMIDHYAYVGKVMGPERPAQTLSSAANHLGQGSSLFDLVYCCVMFLPGIGLLHLSEFLTVPSYRMM